MRCGREPQHLGQPRDHAEQRDHVKVSDRSSIAPAIAPEIDWMGSVAGSATTTTPAGSQPAWLSDFVNGLAQTPGERDPNTAIRIKL